MRKRQLPIIVGLLLCLIIAWAVPQAAMAAGTPACTPIGNTASIAYNVGGFAQAPVSSNTTTFVVGNRVDLTVATTDALPGVPVVSNQIGAVLTFTITNNGNASQKYALTAVPQSGVTTSVFSGNNTVTDSFDAASVALSVSTTAIVTAGSTTTVTIIATMPAGLTNNAYAAYALVAQVINPTTGLAETGPTNSIVSAYGACTADVVIGDAAGTDDIAKDGKHSERSAYHVVLTNLTVGKSSVVYSDPINGTTSPKAIPGAIMEYIVGISNTGSQNATSVTVTDTLPATLTPLSGVNWTSKTGSFGPGCSGQAQVSINGAPWGCLTGALGSSSWSGQQLTATINTLSSGQTATILFQATIQ